jgi:hypothetical protein
MSTLAATNLKNASSGSNNIVLNSDGTVGGAALASTSDMAGVTTTGTNTAGSTTLTVGSATGVSAGMFIVGEGIAPGTTVSTIVGTTVTMSQASAASPNLGLTGTEPVTFYANNKLVSPGVIGPMLCRAWVNFNGTGTVAIRASYNVSSITDNGVGLFTLNMISALADTNYVMIGTTGTTTTTGGTANTAVQDTSAVTARTTIAVQFRCNSSAGANTDHDFNNVAIFR